MANKLKITDSQALAIQYSEEKNVLVSASAGSGKTFVLTNRIIEKIKNAVPIDSLFISTFTVKAAAELKNRIEREIKKELRNRNNSPEVLHLLSKSLQDLPLAVIETTDAFSSQLVKEHYNLVKVDPNFRVLVDTAEQDIIKQEIFNQLVEDALSEEDSSAFEKMAKNFSNDRTIKGLQEIVYKLYNFCQSTENPKDWLEDVFLRSFRDFEHFSDLPSTFNQTVKEDLQEFFDLLRSVISEAGITGKTLEKAEILSDNASDILSALENSDYTNFQELLDLDVLLKGWRMTKEEALPLRDSFDKVIGTKTKSTRADGTVSGPGSVRKFLEKIKFSDLIENHHSDALQIAKDLADFTLGFQEKYLEKKHELLAYEFTDILHFAIQILENEAHPEIRASLKFSEIMIDEYQDTNQAQEKLYQLLSNGKNLFMVGDVKQSIYGFRQANPDLFLKKYKDYPNDESDESNRLMLLQENFRSRKEVLDFTNLVFKNLMENYGSQEALKFPEREGEILDKFNEEYALPTGLSNKAELLIYLEDSEEKGDEQSEVADPDLSDNEIQIAAGKIISLINSGVRPSDIALLVRSKTNNQRIKEVFDSHQIPIILDDTPSNYLKSIEIQVMLDVLRAINNPLFDLSLVAMLHSPLFFFTDDELAQISLNEGRNFWEKLNQQALQKVDSKISQKINEFLFVFNGWREFSKISAVHELLDRVYRERLYPEYVAALPNGELRQANLQSLMTRAYNYEKSGYKGLVKFIDMIDNYLLQNNDLDDVNYKLPEDAVHVQTMHKSKGLEFEYVFIMNFHKRFNQKDLNSKILLDKKAGAGIKYTADLAEQINSKFPYAFVEMQTIPYMWIRELKQKQLLEEEMRMLYVAFTRAKKKIFMLAKVNKRNEIDDAEPLQLEKIPSKGYLTWILSVQDKLKESMEIIINPDYSEEKLSLNALSSLVKKDSTWSETLENAEDFVTAKKIIEFTYPSEKATKLASTLSPSTLEKQIKQFDNEEFEPVKEFEFTLDDIDSKVYTAKDKGTLLHHFMQHIDFTNPSLESLQDLLTRMKAPKELESSIQLPKILSIFDSELGQLIQKNAKSIRCEQAFSMLKTIRDSKGEIIDQTVVRGIIDGYFFSEEKIILFDYKTDRYEKASEIEDIKSRYGDQQALYAEALSRAYPDREIEKYLILLGGKENESVEIVRL